MQFEHGTFSDGATDALSPGQVRGWTGDETYGSSRIPDGFKRSSNAPTCERCWVERTNYRQPVRAARMPRDEVQGAKVCAFCGRPTWAGIFTRVDPTTVPYPQLDTLD